MGLLSLFRRERRDLEAERRARLLRAGRIADGTVLDVGADDAGEISHVFYTYQINGVEYESSQTLDESQRQRPASYAPGASVIVRYDPRQPANSVVV